MVFCVFDDVGFPILVAPAPRLRRPILIGWPMVGSWTLTNNAAKGGTGVLSVDGVEVATVELERIVRGWAALRGMDIGCDNGAPVGLGYESPFRFTGTIDRVEVQLVGRVGPNPTVALRTEMGKQ